jgi:hypothetical protein
MPQATKVGEKMAGQAIATDCVMEGGSSYNLYAKVPAGGSELALPFLEEAARSITLGAEGCSWL